MDENREIPSAPSILIALDCKKLSELPVVGSGDEITALPIIPNGQGGR